MPWGIGRLLGLVTFCLVFTGITAIAQGTINQGTIAGRVLDPQGAAVPGALVRVRHSDTNVAVEAVSDTEGRFRFPYLRIGP